MGTCASICATQNSKTASGISMRIARSVLPQGCTIRSDRLRSAITAVPLLLWGRAGPDISVLQASDGYKSDLCHQANNTVVAQTMLYNSHAVAMDRLRTSHAVITLGIETSLLPGQ